MRRSIVKFPQCVALGVSLLGCCSTPPPPRPCPRVLQGFSVALHARTLTVPAAGRVSLQASCSHPCRIEVHNPDDPSAGALCAQNSSPPAAGGGRHSAACAVELASPGRAISVEVGAVGPDLTYSLTASGALTRSFDDFVVPAGLSPRGG